ncbi:SDR family oxidoreductase [Microvirga sp. G4-2]|uniref:SDR family oxidoreductase n=1 Tax=Microvirga sp. G4-2 TaxID=3434467 RepID=UPI0040443269
MVEIHGLYVGGKPRRNAQRFPPSRGRKDGPKTLKIPALVVVPRLPDPSVSRPRDHASLCLGARGLPRSEANTQQTIRLIAEAGGRATAIRCDVSRADEVKATIARTIEAFGRLDFAFNNAGVEQPAWPRPMFRPTNGIDRSPSV